MRKLMTIAVMLNLLTGCGVLYCHTKGSEVGCALKKAIRDEYKQEIALKEFTKFDWDEFFAFDPYTPTEDVCPKLKIDSTDCKKTIKMESTGDGEMLLVFRYQREIVHVEMHSCYYGDFTPAPEKAYTPATAVFQVVDDGRAMTGGKWLRLRPKATVQ